MQPVAIDPTLDLCTSAHYGRMVEAVWNVKFAQPSAHDHDWGSNPRPFDLESSLLQTPTGVKNMSAQGKQTSKLPFYALY